MPSGEVTVHFYSIMADLAGRREARWTLPAGARLGDLLARIAADHPALGDYARRPDPQAGSPLRVFVNGRLVLDMDAPLAGGDEVRLFPVISGG